jgi:hypothetical protein
MKMKVLQIMCAVAMSALLFTSCKDDDATPPAAQTNPRTILASGAPSGAYTLINLKSGTIVPNTDSASNKWDIAFRLATILINSNASGPGAAAVQVKDGTFESFTQAPETGYAYDTTAAKLALKGPEWYNYDPITRSFSPKAGKTFLLKTADGKYAKMEIISADPTDDNGNAVVPPTRPTKIKYNLRIGYQDDGTRNLQ